MTPPTAVLYGDPFSGNFWSLHTALLERALGSNTAMRYVLRWKPHRREGSLPDEQSAGGVQAKGKESYLSGYGAGLDLKKVDYLVIDDRKLKEVGEDAAASAAQTAAPGRPSGNEGEEMEKEWLHEVLQPRKEGEEDNIASLTAEEIRGE